VRAVSILSAGFGLVLLLLGLGWLAMVLVAASETSRIQPIGSAIALTFTSYGPMILVIGLVLCALAGIEAAIRDLIAAQRRTPPDRP
jgi:TRAP-type C4-dicarboxylate transport system permease small subunit